MGKETESQEAPPMTVRSLLDKVNGSLLGLEEAIKWERVSSMPEARGALEILICVRGRAKRLVKKLDFLIVTMTVGGIATFGSFCATGMMDIGSRSFSIATDAFAGSLTVSMLSLIGLALTDYSGERLVNKYKNQIEGYVLPVMGGIKEPGEKEKQVNQIKGSF